MEDTVPYEHLMSMRNNAAKWPNRLAQNRLFPDCTPEITPKNDISAAQTFFAIGSCFARNIEDYLVRAGLNVVSRDFSVPNEEKPGARRSNDILVKYTPPSIESELRMSHRFDPIENALVEVGKNEFIDLYLGSHVPVTFERAMERRRQVTSLYQRLSEVDVVVLTLGLIESWFDTLTGQGICSAPTRALNKKYPKRFQFKLLSYDESRNSVAQSIEMLLSHGVKNIIITTSPVPLGRTFTNQDVIVANAHSKAMLRTVAQEMVNKFAEVDYFPSYEMVMHSDALMSWNDDQRHVRDARVGLIVSRFLETHLKLDQSDLMRARKAHSQAKIKLDQGKVNEAIILFDIAKEHLGDEREFLLDWVEALSKSKRHEETLDVYHRLLDKDPKALKVRIKYAATLSKFGDLVSAQEAFRGILDDHPGHALSTAMLIKILAADGKNQDSASLANTLATALLRAPKEGLFVYRTVIDASTDYKMKAAITEMAETFYPQHFSSVANKG